MILIKKNTSEFKELKHLLLEYADVPGRKRWIYLYTLKPYQTLSHKILLNTRIKDGDTLYNMAYDSLKEYLYASTKRLFYDEKTELYFFKSTATSKWMEAPFELRGKLKKQVRPLKVMR
ncbi:hypothetical protein CNR22_04395 [Sphingobacteriaceae bacterium]|nr:hypothetical protein CNR22_04395 [Sphingobacteriaceae bacterium]